MKKLKEKKETNGFDRSEEFAFWSRVEGRGSRVTSRGSRVNGRGSRVTSRGSRVNGRGSKNPPQSFLNFFSI